MTTVRALPPVFDSGFPAAWWSFLCATVRSHLSGHSPLLTPPLQETLLVAQKRARCHAPKVFGSWTKHYVVHQDIRAHSIRNSSK